MAAEVSSSRGEAFKRRVADLFRRAGWKVRPKPAAGDLRADLLVQRGEHSYAVELKSAPEGRRDRMLPLLAQAILQARAFAERSKESVAPLAIVGARSVSATLVRDLDRFAQDYAPDVAVGLVDMEGFQWFRGPGIDPSMNAPRGRAQERLRVRVPVAAASHLFSDLNQWMLKVLLAPGIPSDLMNAPRNEYRNASQLAVAANASVMSAFRLLRQLRIEGFLDESSSILSLVRLEELLRRWQAESQRPARDVPMRWILRGDPTRQLQDAVRALASESAAVPSRSRRHEGPPPRLCLGLFAAADALGLGFVHGVAPLVHLERIEPGVLERLGLSLEAPRASPDLYIRVPAARESVFRGAVLRDGVPVSDVVQVWLDAGAFPSRGPEQADLIYRRVFRLLLDKARR
jgi:Holliday junction resolvase